MSHSSSNMKSSRGVLEAATSAVVKNRLTQPARKGFIFVVKGVLRAGKAKLQRRMGSKRFTNALYYHAGVRHQAAAGVGSRIKTRRLNSSRVQARAIRAVMDQ